MKAIAFAALLVLAVPAMGQTRLQIAADSSYATNDTTAWFSLNATDYYWVQFYFKDSVNVLITADYRCDGVPVTVFQSVNLNDSTNSTAAAGYFKGYELRGYVVDNIVAADRIRFRITRKTTKNGVSSPTYDAWLLRGN